MEKIVFGDNLPGYEFGPKNKPAVLVIQVHDELHIVAICTTENLPPSRSTSAI